MARMSQLIANPHLPAISAPKGPPVRVTDALIAIGFVAPVVAFFRSVTTHLFGVTTLTGPAWDHRRSTFHSDKECQGRMRCESS